MSTRMKDVAKHAGVSTKTVSNVVNGYEHVTPELRERVNQAIADLDYRPNLSARSLRSGKTGIIALALPELDAAYFAEIAQQVVLAAGRRGWTVLVDATGGERGREREVAAGFRGGLVDGMIMSPLGLAAEDLAGRDPRTPLVLLGERVVDVAADHVFIDNIAAAKEATAHLLRSGRRRVAAIGAQRSPSAATAQQRQQGYRVALKEAGVRYDSKLVINAERWHRGDGAAAATRLMSLAQPPDAIFCFNDLLALGAMRALREQGLAVGRDVAVVGFDDVEEGRFSVPSLSTISPDKQQIAETAVGLLASRLGPGADQAPAVVTADYRLLVRESSQS